MADDRGDKMAGNDRIQQIEDDVSGLEVAGGRLETSYTAHNAEFKAFRSHTQDELGNIKTGQTELRSAITLSQGQLHEALNTKVDGLRDVITDSQKWLIFASIIFVGWMIVLLAPVLTPFLLSTLLAYLGDPLVDRLEEYGATRTLAVGIVFLGMFVLGICAVIVVLPALQSQATVLIQKIPTALEWMQSNLLPRVSSLLGGTPIEIDIPAVKETLVSHWQDVGSVAKNLMAHIGRSSQVLIGWVTYLLLIPVVTFYLLRIGTYWLPKYMIYCRARLSPVLRVWPKKLMTCWRNFYAVS